MEIEAFNDTIILEPHELESNSHSNIIRPDLGKEVGKFGKVVAVGPGRHVYGTFVKTNLEVGDVVVIPPMGFVKFEVEDKEYYSGAESTILAKIKE